MYPVHTGASQVVSGSLGTYLNILKGLDVSLSTQGHLSLEAWLFSLDHGKLIVRAYFRAFHDY